jgi:hydroxyethylthiazole kinase-like uncharacterized protein yjeF
MDILTGAQMRNVDRRAIDSLGIPGLSLMEAAGLGIAEAILVDYPEIRSTGVSIVCGKGNNGGDGLVVARHLASQGVVPRIFLICQAAQIRGDAATNLQAARAAGLEITEVPDTSAWAAVRANLNTDQPIVDAMLGTGVQGGARGLMAEVIADINTIDVPRIAIDLPSGLNADSADVLGAVVSAERTYTLCRPKLALVFPPAATHAGNWSVIPIGIPDSVVAAEGASIEWLDRVTAAALLPKRTTDSHKGTYGHLLAVAGSQGKSGAAVLVARAALRCGVGLITVAAPASIQELIASQQAEVMTEGLPDTYAGVINSQAVNTVIELLRTRNALAIGPGLGMETGTRSAVIALLRRRTAPTVLDADGLNALGKLTDDSREIFKTSQEPLVLTPHPGEAARLLDCSTTAIQADRSEAARRLTDLTGATVVLKGHRTLIASPEGRISVNSTGNPGMATAGSGDVLTGAVGAFLARGLSGWDASRLAVFVHGSAGDHAADRMGEESLIATDITNALPSALLALGDYIRDGS